MVLITHILNMCYKNHCERNTCLDGTWLDFVPSLAYKENVSLKHLIPEKKTLEYGSHISLANFTHSFWPSNKIIHFLISFIDIGKINFLFLVCCSHILSGLLNDRSYVLACFYFITADVQYF